ncbi:MAG: hypothetical protein ACKO85_06610, partial [Isosphaeraceae bacterium]
MSAIKIAVVKSPAAVSRNAVRHGLSGSFYVPENARLHVDEIRKEIVSQFRVYFFEGEKIVEEMAICRWQVFEADRLLDEAREREIAEAGLHYDRFLENERAEFQAILETDPERGVSLLKQNIYGSDSLIAVWAEARKLVHENLSFYGEILRRMVSASGSHWSMDRITHDALQMVSLCLAVTPSQVDAELIAREWLSDLAPESREVALRRLAEYRHRYGQAADAESQIIAIIDDKIDELSQHKQRLEQNLEQSIAGFAAAHAGHGMLNPLLMKEAALLQRYRTRAMNRFEKLESKLQHKLAGRKQLSGSGAAPVRADDFSTSTNIFAKSFCSDSEGGNVAIDKPLKATEPEPQPADKQELIATLPNNPPADDRAQT